MSSILIAGTSYNGPIICDSCRLDHPVPDATTKKAIDDNLPLIGLMRWDVGDVFIVCNTKECAHYTVTSDYLFYSFKPKEPRTQSKPRMGGSGGPGGEGGGGGSGGGGAPNPGGSGCAPKCTGGTVIVREPGRT
ncbi:hypothetical protein [Lysobacter enzymogenes]|uniref:hypothetical protein n=1 Tax=Lysobacter enzymogenes TaxID=69 RepID=UPI0009F3CD62|nr:hypothetical protein [Lysobacter enzymogenes]